MANMEAFLCVCDVAWHPLLGYVSVGMVVGDVDQQ